MSDILQSWWHLGALRGGRFRGHSSGSLGGGDRHDQRPAPPVLHLPGRRDAGRQLCWRLDVGLLLVSRLPLLYVFKRVMLIELSVAREGLLVFANVSTKAIICSLALILLSSTTGFINLLRGLQTLRMSRVLLMTLSFAYRYLFVLIDEAMRMWRARNRRNYGGRWCLTMSPSGPSTWGSPRDISKRRPAPSPG